MASKLTQRQTIDKLLSKYEPEIRKVFLESIEKIKSRIVLKELIARLETGDINGALTALDIDFTDFVQLDNILSQTYNAGGVELANYLPALFDASGARVVIRFNARNIRAEQWLKDRSSNLITNIVDEQRNNIRTILQNGMAQGNNPRTVALDMVGRVNPLTQRREGGIIGLSRPQQQYVINAREELYSGNAKQMAKFLERERRDKRFDSVIQKAIKEGKKLDKATVEKITGRYSDSLLKLRAETIARTEALASLNSAKDEAFQQGLEKTEYNSQDVSKVWRSASDKRVRDSHASLNGQTVHGLNTAFVSSTGAHLKYPHDTSLGAGAEDVINCRCIVQYKIDFAKGLNGNDLPLTEAQIEQLVKSSPVAKTAAEDIQDSTLKFFRNNRFGLQQGKIVDGDEFDQIECQVMFRGVRSIEHIDSNIDGQWVGRGVYGNGNYYGIGTIGRKLPFEGYSDVDSGGWVYAAKLSEDAKIISSEELAKLKVPDGLFFADDGRKAAYLGFDAIKASKGSELVLINNSKLIVDARSLPNGEYTVGIYSDAQKELIRKSLIEEMQKSISSSDPVERGKLTEIIKQIGELEGQSTQKLKAIFDEKY